MILLFIIIIVITNREERVENDVKTRPRSYSEIKFVISNHGNHKICLVSDDDNDETNYAAHKYTRN